MEVNMDTVYDPKTVEPTVYEKWTSAGAFHAEPGDGENTYSIVIPPPNVTAQLHLGHALNDTLQDILVRHHRMAGANTLWMPGTDHAGIATQTVVEKRILAEEGRRRTDFDRDEFVARVQEWKDEYEDRILGQLQAIGCSCDWDRTRFTMDEVCARAVREAFFRLFADGLIYRGKRLVNWDPATQTVLADDEVEHETVEGHFWYLQYPLVEPVDCSTGAPPVCAAGVSPVGDEAPVTKKKGANLPPWTREGSTYAVTFRLADSLPKHVIDGWRRDRELLEAAAQSEKRPLTHLERKELKDLYVDRIDAALAAGQGACCLRDERVAEIVRGALMHFDGRKYDLIAWCIMPNHVHVVVAPREGHVLPEILHSWKSCTAKEANRVLGRQGQFWQVEYYDHLIRDEEDFNASVQSVLSNPERAGLHDWRWLGHKAYGQDGHGTHGREARGTITHVTVATTRPETMLGDTAVAMNPNDPRAAALVGRKVRLPIVGREIPIIADEHVVTPDPDSDDPKARFSTGFLKVTPAHDPDDWAIGQRHDLPVINVMAPDGTISDRHGWEDADAPEARNLLGMDRFEAREAIVEFFRSEGLLEDVRPYAHEVGHSYRSHVPIEPYLSDQWYIAVKQATGEEATDFIPGTDVPVNSLAGLALKPLLDGDLKFTPERYAKAYQTWLENLRDWPISRQLWWGHRIPIWTQDLELPEDIEAEPTDRGPDARTCAALDRAMGEHFGNALKDLGPYYLTTEEHPEKPGWIRTYICLHDENPEQVARISKAGWRRDPDVLDTWFSSALWPISTMGWPEETELLKAFYPTDLLCTAREIITLWVSRMVMFGEYFRGEKPFTDVYIHAMIQDGQGRKMSKSLGNGMDPLDIVESHGADAMRFTLAYMTTETQDVRMPVETMTLPDGRRANSSPKFDLGRNFCNKLWNASRFAIMNLEGLRSWNDSRPGNHLADAWLLSRMNRAVRDVTEALRGYRFHDVAETIYRFMWNDFCDWYLEIAKVRIAAGEAAPRALVAHGLDVLLRLAHPVIPFITEQIWSQLNAVAPTRGPADQPAEALLVTAGWPRADASTINDAAEDRFALLQELIGGIREVRSRHNVPPSRKVAVTVAADREAAELVRANGPLIEALASTEPVRLTEDASAGGGSDATVVAGPLRALVHDVIDVDAERARLAKQQETLRRGIASAEGKLGNDRFVQNAPPEVVQRERERLEAMRGELATVENALAQLG
jgi:valyl-tRNA synthetase